jgi:hypothetical protein
MSLVREEVTMMTSSAMPDSSLIPRYTSRRSTVSFALKEKTTYRNQVTRYLCPAPISLVPKFPFVYSIYMKKKQRAKDIEEYVTTTYKVNKEKEKIKYDRNEG